MCARWGVLSRRVCINNLDCDVKELKQCICKQKQIPFDQQKLFFKKRELRDEETLSSLNIKNKSKLKLVILWSGFGGALLSAGCLHLNPSMDIDLTAEVDIHGKKVFRGVVEYTLPYRWKGYGLSRKSDRCGRQHPENDVPVAYTGVSIGDLQTIVRHGHCKLSGTPAELYGDGILCTPNIETARQMATRFEYQGKLYVCVLENEVNHENTKPIDCDLKELWMCPAKEDLCPIRVLFREIGTI